MNRKAAESASGVPGSSRRLCEKGGNAADAEAKVCLCNGLGSAAGYGQSTRTGEEPFIVTLGKDTGFYKQLEVQADGSYSAEDVVRAIMSPVREPAAS
ncbi:MAG: hypothetical protein IPF51_16395 [Dehalococcoidia bacterium]|uniref:hypothetical protein n=1 Tax=Candidatus Amarobacter glycogenicus TaxID=3140699 RepID=UPI00313730E8|nr:hypothetical protein [Dehalococcoidia bacterium]